MLRAPLRWAYGRLGARYPRVLIALQFQVAHLVTAAGVWLLDLYVDLSRAEFWRIFWFCQIVIAIENATALAIVFRMLRPADPWLRGTRTPESAVAAWRALAGLPLAFLRFGRGLPILISVVPIALYVTYELRAAAWPSLPILLAASAIVLLYGTFLRFFAIELILRPVLEAVSRELPDGAELGKASVSLKWKLLIALPAINIISGVVVVGFASPRDSGLDQLGLGVLVTIAVAFTISLELSVLLLRSILEPLDDLQAGHRAVAANDLSVRVPVLGTDETGRLTGSFNRMVAGLEERERLREAFGAFVDPDVADRVLLEGTVLEGEEVEVTVLFVDIRGFTAFAERAGARDVVARLNEFYEVVVPVLARHGGHANKFVGDGLLGVFGAPDLIAGHADHAVAAALETVGAVHDRFGGELRIGIGVNSGTVVAGTIGGGGRVEFTVIGDAVNTAARVEEVTRRTDDDILVTEATRALLTREHCALVPRGDVVLKGKRDRVRLWAAVPAGGRAADGGGTLVDLARRRSARGS